MAHRAGDVDTRQRRRRLRWVRTKDAVLKIGRFLSEWSDAADDPPTWETVFQKTSLYASARSIGAVKAGILADALMHGALPRLTSLNLSYNQIGDAGLTELSRASASGSLGALQRLYLSGNKVGDEGIEALASPIASGSLPSLQTLLVDDGPLGTEHHGI